MSEKYGCKCEGHWTTRLLNYFVVRRNLATVEDIEVPSKYSEVKCRQCRRKWRSNASYVEKLPDGKERKYKKLTYRMLLDLIKAGRVKANLATGVIYKQKRWGNQFKRSCWEDVWVELTQKVAKNGEGYLIVDIKHNGHRRWFLVHILVWMCANKGLVPKGHEVHHKDTHKFHNAYKNLENLLRAEHMDEHWEEEF